MDLCRDLGSAEDQPRPGTEATDHRQLMLQGFEALAILEATAGAQDPDLGGEPIGMAVIFGETRG